MLDSLIRVGAVATAFALAAVVGSVGPRAGSDNERTLSLYNIHTKERLVVVYKRDGAYVQDGLEKLNWHLRDWRRNEPTKMDPKVFDILWEVYTELGSQKPIHVVSGYRSPRTNESLRRKGGGQAKNSQHTQGRAMDVHFPDIPVQRLRYSALVRERGGVGYYPTSALPFVHIDTGRVRMWPRMPRQELALLFPNGRSKYVPGDGRPISPADVVKARKSYAKLAAVIADFHAFRAKPKDRTLVASLEADASDSPSVAVAAAAEGEEAEGAGTALSASAAETSSGSAATTGAKVMTKPKVASLTPSLLPKRKPKATTAAAAAAEEAILPPEPVPVSEKIAAAMTKKRLPLAEQLAAEGVAGAGKTGGTVAVASLGDTILPPVPEEVDAGSAALLSKAGWATAPEYDDDHGDELSYRPFPITPLLDTEPDIDHPLLARLAHPRFGEARQAIVMEASGEGMRFKPGLRVAEMMWADQFTGADRAIAWSGEDDTDGGARKSGVRKVKTAKR